MKKQTTTTTTSWNFPPLTLCNPQAYIACCDNRIKSYQHEGEERIYLEDGTEFQFEFYNDSDCYVKAEITINGKTESSALVLRPNQRFYLDRFMDEKKKFKFNTFLTGNDDIEKLKEIIETNGRIKIQFYKEYVAPTWKWSTVTTDSGNWGLDNCTYDQQLSRGRGMSKSLTAGGIQESFCCANMSQREEPEEIETGRIEAGEKSNQDFSLSHKSFDVFPTATFEYHIMPQSHKPKKAKKKRDVIVADDIRTYCPGCGRRLKKGWNFCAGCGKKF